MKKIFKYNLHYYSVPELVELPKGAEVVDFGIQAQSFKIWAMVDPTVDKKEQRVFMLGMTGQPITFKVIKTFGTVIVQESGIVIHLLELDPKTKAKDPKKDDRLTEALKELN